jgi:hypothetical protein
MALRHQLSLNIVDGCNPTNFTIIDTSNYATGLQINCPTLAITIPGTAGPIYFSQGTLPAPGSDPNDVYNQLVTNPTPYTGNPKFVLTIDNIFLCLQPAGATLTNLPDGLWEISYCIQPCDNLSIKYYYLRTTYALHRYAGLLCKLRLSNCLPSQETLEMIDQLHIIKMYLDAAKAKVEVCHAPKEGIAMYEYALKLMNNWEKTCCSTC